MPDTFMPEGLAHTISFTDLLIRFLVGSTILFAVALWLEKYARSPRSGMFIWKTAIVGSLLFFIPQIPGIQTDINVPAIRFSSIETFVQQQVSPVDKGIEISSLPKAKREQTIITTQPAYLSALPYLDSGIEAIDRLAPAVPVLAGFLIFLSLIKLIMGYRQASNHLRAGSRVEAEHPVNLLLKTISDAANLKQKPDLYIYNAIASPLSGFGNRIFLPNRLFHEMNTRELEVILSHEVSHIRQRDLVWLTVGRILQKIFIFQPLFRYAVKKLEYYAELAADEWAAHQLQDNKLVASTLYQCALFQQSQQNQRGKPIIHADVALFGMHLHADGSDLFKRIKNLLGHNKKTNSARLVHFWPGGFAAVFFIGALYGMPLVHWAPLPSANCTAFEDVFENGQCYISVENFRTISAYSSGSITLNDRYDGIADLPAGDSITFIDKEPFRKKRYLNISKTSEGFVFDYRVGDERRIMDQNARMWLKEALFFTVLGDGHTAPVRVPYLLEQGGLPMVIEEMKHLKTKYAVQNYTRALREAKTLALSEEHERERLGSTQHFFIPKVDAIQLGLQTIGLR